MVLKITVKTLESNNYEFEANDDWTVRQFKDNIQETVQVPADEQRLIFCGRVLLDDKKLTEYDCKEKVIHLVPRPPPPLNNPDQPAASGIDPNNNTDASAGTNDRLFDEGQIFINAMTVGPESVNQILRQMLTLQQATYGSGAADGSPAGATGVTGAAAEPISMTNLDRHLQNAARLLRVTVTVVNDRMARIAGQPPNASQPPNPNSTTESPRPSNMSSASSHTDLQRDSEMLTSETSQQQRLQSPSSGVPVDRMGVGSNGETSTRRGFAVESVMRNHPDWLPIIEADINLMERQATIRPTFSDAYLNSISRKRRRLLTISSDRIDTLQPSPSQAISSLLRRAITSSGVPGVESLDQVLLSISSDTELQSAYEDHIKTTVEARLRSDPDYCPQKFENSSKYFK